MPARDQTTYRSRRFGTKTAALAAIWLCPVVGGCSGGAPSASISQAGQITLYEGLPHQMYEPRALVAEKSAKPTVELDGFPFYSETLDLNVRDADALKALLASADSFQPFSGEKKCGGFHPDYAVEWTISGVVYRCLVCFGCYEAAIHGPKGLVTYDIERAAFERLQQLLAPYRKNRPTFSPEL